MTNIHSINNNYTNNSKKKTKGRKSFICSGYGNCSMTFTRAEHLARHIRKHTGEKPFQCNVCKKFFSRIDNLKQHKESVHAKNNNNSDLINGNSNTPTNVKETISSSFNEENDTIRSPIRSPDFIAKEKMYSQPLTIGGSHILNNFNNNNNVNTINYTNANIPSSDSRSHYNFPSQNSNVRNTNITTNNPNPSIRLHVHPGSHSHHNNITGPKIHPLLHSYSRQTSSNHTNPYFSYMTYHYPPHYYSHTAQLPYNNIINQSMTSMQTNAGLSNNHNSKLPIGNDRPNQDDIMMNTYSNNGDNIIMNHQSYLRSDNSNLLNVPKLSVNENISGNNNLVSAETLADSSDKEYGNLSTSQETGSNIRDNSSSITNSTMSSPSPPTPKLKGIVHDSKKAKTSKTSVNYILT